MAKNKEQHDKAKNATPQADTVQNTEIEDILNTDNDTQAIEDLAAETVNENQKLVEELDKTRAELEKEKKEYLFLMADFDNFRKRVVKEKAELLKNGAEKALKGLLPIIDDFERGLEATKDAEDADAVRQGMQLIYQKFVKYLNDNNVTVMVTDPGTKFDADLHEAIATIPAPQPEMKGAVIDTTQRGYMLNDKVLRHAKVVVGE